MVIPPRKTPNVLEWKFPGVEGIETRENDNAGTIEITAWPTGQGARPTATQLDTWFREWKAAGADQPEPSRLDVIERALLDKQGGGLERADLDKAIRDIKAERRTQKT